MHRCVDHAGAHGIDPDAVAHDFGGEAHGHGVDRSLRAAIVDERLGEPVSAPIDETLTMLPPLPPCLVDMRLTASRQAIRTPAVFTARMSMISWNV